MRNPGTQFPDPSVALIKQAVVAKEEHLPDLPDPTPGIAQAAVSVILRGGADLDVLLIKRAEAEGDPWSGHMAFPGGRRNSQDASLVETAMRETREETGVRLDQFGAPLGRLHPLEPSTFRLPPISIFPFVFSVPGETTAYVASQREVDEIVWTPLSSLRDPEAHGFAPIDLGDRVKTFPCFRLGERVVWGLTYRILNGLFEILPDGYPSSP